MMMSSAFTAICRIAVFVILAQSSDVLAQAAVRDVAPARPSAIAIPTTSAPVAVSAGGQVSTNEAYKIQQLQQEILELRGLVEEQGFELKRLKQQRLDDYLDIDKRLTALSNNTHSATLDTKPSADLATTIVNSSSNNNTEAEKALYRKAIDQLLNQQDYKGAQTSFEQYLDNYPQGSYAPNVYYWQGQIYLTESKKVEAEKTFTTLIKTYPDNQKIPDAKYKLATIYFDQGKKAQAKTLLQEVAASDSDASRLAKSFLANQFK
jgi:tol-pal system protein YbgF